MDDHTRLRRHAEDPGETPQFEPDTSAGPLLSGAVGGLLVGSADDPLEAAADRAASSALSRIRRSATGGIPHRHDPGCGHTAVQRTASSVSGASVGHEGGALDVRTDQRINSLRSSGTPLAHDLRVSMETAFGSPLDKLRIHTGGEAAAISRQISAKAFTTGNDIFLGEGQFRPDSPEGAHTLAHEIAHTLQPGGGARRLLGQVRRSTGVIRRDDDEVFLTAAQIEKTVKDYSGPAKNWSIGTATASQTNKAAISWLGSGQYEFGGGMGWKSKDGLRQYRAPAFKPNQGLTQANFEVRETDSGEFTYNGHVTIKTQSPTPKKGAS